VHEENQKKTRFGARRKVKKNTVWCTKKAQKKHDLVLEENQKKARLGARRKPEKSTIWCTKKTTKKLELEHDLVYEAKSSKRKA
jgi:hypothetical protein